ncbi:MAG TPA: hypothetical protein VGR62_04840 [Candidatus Binatia bacterium]|jgi:hypothetical protein|nr:hypothetical protein [Candidatus Binatia bacterium]
MHDRWTSGTLLVAGVILLGSFGDGARAQVPNDCAATKIRATAKKATCTVSLESGPVSTGRPIDPAKTRTCEQKFESAFARRDTRGGRDIVGDAALIEGLVDAFVADVRSQLAIALPNRFQAQKLRATAKMVTCLGTLAANRAQRGER